jgi:DUF4097 and DUF4098 domain-containing protein YvlB
MSTMKFDRDGFGGCGASDRDASETPTARADRVAVWILLAVGLLLMLLSTSAARAQQGSAGRTDRITGTLAAGQSLSVENVSGDVVATRGNAFSAVVTITVTAPTQKEADDLLRNTSISQSHDEDGWALETRWPGMHGHNNSGRRRGADCERCRVVANYAITVPAGVTTQLQTVNGDVRVQDLDGSLALESVNGAIDARGVRGPLQAETVNGSIGAVALGLSDPIELQSVNGSITLTLPKDARFDLTAETMNGTIASTFPFAAQAPFVRKGAPRPKGSHKDKDTDRQIVVTSEDGVTQVIDLDELDAELAESMHEIEMEIEEAEREGRTIRRGARQIRIVDPRRDYSGSIGRGGTPVQIETLNGTIVVLAAGTREADAKTLVSERREFVVTVPEVRVKVPNVHVEVNVPKVKPPKPPNPPRPPVPPVPGVPPVPPDDFEGEVVRGDIGGDFLSTTSGGSYRLGRVSGSAKIVTHSGEIRIAGVGAGAELKSYGGDIVVGPVTGDLKASTAAGDIRADTVSGTFLADTAGGDIRVQSVGGNLDANTAGGDVIAPRVGGSVRAVTAGGDVRIGVTSKDVKGGIVIRNSGGDVTLVLPPDCKADVELIVTGADDDDDGAIRSEFGYQTIDKKPGTQRAVAVLNGGGEKIVVRTTSGSIRLRKAPAGP